MSKKKKSSERAGIYALCITIGLIIGLGLSPVFDNLAVMLIVGAIGGALAGYLFDRQSHSRRGHRHGHH